MAPVVTSIRERVHQPFYDALVNRFPFPAQPYRGTTAATQAVLFDRACYGGRKGNSARRRLGIRPSTSAQAFRAARVLAAFNAPSHEAGPSEQSHVTLALRTFQWFQGRAL